MAVNINTILQWFKTGKKPTEQQFADTWQSFWHKDEIIPQATIESLETVLDTKASKEELEAHINHPLPTLQQINEMGNIIEGESFWKDTDYERSIGISSGGFKIENSGITTNIVFDEPIDSTGSSEKSYHVNGSKNDGDTFAMISDIEGTVPYNGALTDVNLGKEHKLNAGYVSVGYDGISPESTILSVRNSVIPAVGETSTVLSTYNSAGTSGVFVYVDSNDVHHIVNRGNGNIGSNTSYGSAVLSNNTSGYENTAVGQASLYNNTEGRSNMAFGSFTLNGNITGTRNTAMGAQALYSNTTASFNVGVGHQTLRNNQTVENNVAIGYSSGQNTTGGSGDNVFIGSEAARNLVNASKNVFIGRQSATNVSTSTWASNGNTGVGYQSMAISWNTDLSYNTAFGYQSLRNIKAGNYNSFFGAWTGSSSSENQVLGSYNTVIGSQVILTTAEKSASNQVILSDGQGNRVLFKESSGNVNITGNTYPGSNSTYDFGSTTLQWKNIWGGTGNFGNLLVTNIPTVNTGGTVWLTRNTSTGLIESTLPGYAPTIGLVTTPNSTSPLAANDIVTNLSRIYGNLLTLKSYTSKTASYTIVASDDTIDFTGATTATATLLSAVGNTGKRFTIKNSGTGIITVATTASQTIDGNTTFSLKSQYATLTVQSDGANWKVMSVYGI